MCDSGDVIAFRNTSAVVPSFQTSIFCVWLYCLLHSIYGRWLLLSFSKSIFPRFSIFCCILFLCSSVHFISSFVSLSLKRHFHDLRLPIYPIYLCLFPVSLSIFLYISIFVSIHLYLHIFLSVSCIYISVSISICQ